MGGGKFRHGGGVSLRFGPLGRAQRNCGGPERPEKAQTTSAQAGAAPLKGSEKQVGKDGCSRVTLTEASLHKRDREAQGLLLCQMP